MLIPEQNIPLMINWVLKSLILTGNDVRDIRQIYVIILSVCSLSLLLHRGQCPQTAWERDESQTQSLSTGLWGCYEALICIRMNLHPGYWYEEPAIIQTTDGRLTPLWSRLREICGPFQSVWESLVMLWTQITGRSSSLHKDSQSVIKSITNRAHI